MNRAQRLAQFQQDASGTYHYCGAHLTYVHPKLGRPGLWSVIWSLTVLASAASVGAGCFSVSGLQNSPLVLLPYVGEIGAVGAWLWAVVRWSAAGRSVRLYIYEATAEKLPFRTGAAALFAALGILGTGVWLMCHGFRQTSLLWIAPVLLRLVTIGSACGLSAVLRPICWQLTDTPSEASERQL